MKQVAIIILNYNGQKYLEQFLPSVRQHSPNCEIWVADNASTDQSLTWLRALPDVRVLVIPGQQGVRGRLQLRARQNQGRLLRAAQLRRGGDARLGGTHAQLPGKVPGRGRLPAQNQGLQPPHPFRVRRGGGRLHGFFWAIRTAGGGCSTPAKPTTASTTPR